MTAEEIVNRIERAGGWLKLTAVDKVKVNVPAEAGDLIDAVKAQKPAVVEVLKQRIGGRRCFHIVQPVQAMRCTECMSA